MEWSNAVENIYSRLKLVKNEKIAAIIDSFIAAIKKNYYIKYVDCYKSEIYSGVFIYAKIQINIPSKGVYQSIDIQNEEEVLIYFHEKYPRYAPSVIMCRNDFPFKHLPHINYKITKTNINELNLCLLRGDIDEWYFNHYPEDFLNLIIKWFEDAVNGRLIKNDGFETIRYDNDLYGFLVADFESLSKTIENNELQYGFKFLNITINEKNAIINNQEKFINSANSFPCILLGSSKSVETLYMSKNITKVKDLKGFKSYNYLNRSISRLFNTYYYQKDIELPNFVHVVFSIKRPQQVIGSFNNYEFICIKVNVDKINKNVDEFKVDLLFPIRLLNKEISSKLSNVISSERKLVIAGCGALGSKVSLNLARMGFNQQILIDDDIYLPHNSVRNEIFPPTFFGINKASLISHLIKLMYTENKVININKNGMDFEFEKYTDYSIIDCTVSQQFMYFVLNNQTIIHPIMRCEISDSGKLGINYLEGEERNPNLLEMRFKLWYMALENDDLSNWLINNSEEKEFNEVSIGYGCSSNTMVLDNSTISNHASIVPHAYINKHKSLTGTIFLNFFKKENLEKNYVKIYDVEKFIRIELDGIRVSISNIALEKALVTLDDVCENAGIWIGGYDDILNEIIIIDTYISKEHIREKHEIKCGINDVNEVIAKIMKKTNNLLGYVGEWHTHLNADSSPSSKDIEAYKLVRNTFNINHRPLLMSIFSKCDCTHTIIK